jgi:hypothetical protein
MQRYQQGSLQEAQAQHQVGMKRRGQGIAMISRLGNTTAGFAQLGVIHRHTHQRAGTPGQSLFQDGSKQLLGIPDAAGMQKILGAPVAVLAAIGPDDARQGTAPQTDQQPQ